MNAILCDAVRDPFPPLPASGERIDVRGLELDRRNNPHPLKGSGDHTTSR